MHGSPVQPELRHHARAKVFDQHVGLLGELQHQLRAAIGLQVDANISLAAVLLREVGRETGGLATPQSRDIAIGGLNLTTSAPRSESVRPAIGPAKTRDRSSTFTPSSGRGPAIRSACLGQHPVGIHHLDLLAIELEQSRMGGTSRTSRSQCRRARFGPLIGIHPVRQKSPILLPSFLPASPACATSPSALYGCGRCCG